MNLQWVWNRLILPPIRFKGAFAMKIAVAAAVAVLAVTMPAAEKPPAFQATSVLGADAKGPNWTVSPEVRSDGFVRLYTVETTYGKFQVNGHRRMQDQIGRASCRERV